MFSYEFVCGSHHHAPLQEKKHIIATRGTNDDHTSSFQGVNTKMTTHEAPHRYPERWSVPVHSLDNKPLLERWTSEWRENSPTKKKVSRRICNGANPPWYAICSACISLDNCEDRKYFQETCTKWGRGEKMDTERLNASTTSHTHHRLRLKSQDSLSTLSIFSLSSDDYYHVPQGVNSLRSLNSHSICYFGPSSLKN